MKCKGCLTMKAINDLNNDFRSTNPYSISQYDWVTYETRITKLQKRLEKYQCISV